MIAPQYTNSTIGVNVRFWPLAAAPIADLGVRYWGLSYHAACIHRQPHLHSSRREGYHDRGAGAEGAVVGAQVFISYSSKDSKPARAICSALESRGLSCWISSRDVGPGENFMDAIVNAIGVAKVMVLVFSENANNSEDIKREIVLASSGKVTIIPVRVEDVVPKGAFACQFATRQWIDLFEDWEAQIERLAKWIAGTAPATPKAQANAEPKNPIPDSAAIDSDRRAQEEAQRRDGEETQRKRDEAEAQRIAEDNRRQQAEAQRIAEEQGQQRAEAERLAQEEKDRIRAAAVECPLLG